jgi:hypothetical protein
MPLVDELQVGGSLKVTVTLPVGGCGELPLHAVNNAVSATTTITARIDFFMPFLLRMSGPETQVHVARQYLTSRIDVHSAWNFSGFQLTEGLGGTCPYGEQLRCWVILNQYYIVNSGHVDVGLRAQLRMREIDYILLR